MQCPNSSYLWSSRLSWSCLQGMPGIWQGRLSRSGSVLGFSERNLLWCTLPSPSFIISFSVCDSRHSWLVQHRSGQAIAFDVRGSYVRPICKREGDGWGGKREREGNHSLQMCKAQALLKGNMLGIKWYEVCQIWYFLTDVISTFLKRDKNKLCCN